jgi:HK97 family phage major capsid protein
MSEVQVVKNNQTAIEEILAQIKGMNEGRPSMEQFNELKNAIDNRNKELDERDGKLEAKMQADIETKLATFVEKFGNAFEKAAFRKGPDPEEQRFKNMGEFLSKVKNKMPEIKDLSEVSGDGGGYLVPEIYSNEILRIDLETSVVRNSGARSIPMTTNILKVPALQQTSNAAGSLYGGAAAYWGSENGSMTESQPKFERVILELKKLYGYTEDPNELEEDAMVSMGALLTEIFGEVLAFEEDYNFINGDGVGKPLGVLTAPCLVTVSRTSASEVRTLDIINMIARFRGRLDRAVINLNQTALAYVYQLRDANNNYIWHPGNAGNISGAPQGTVYGIPLRVTEKCPAVGTTGDILLADWGFYLIGDKNNGRLRVDYSQHFKFQNDQMAYRVLKRVDGQPWLKSAITPRAGGSTLSPFVAVT